MSSLYEFTVGTTPYRYTSADTDVTYDSNTYTAIAIERSEIFLDFLQDTLTIKMQADQQPASNFKNDIHVERIELTVRSLKTSSAETLFKGYVLKGTYDLKQDLITFNCKRFPEGESSLNRVFGTSCGFGWGEAFRQANPSAGGTFTASSGSGSATGTNFNLLSAGDYIWVEDAVYKVTSVTGSTALTMTPNAVSAYSGVNWYDVTDLKGCPVNREEYKETIEDISAEGYSFTTGSYGATDTLTGPSSGVLFADDANDVDASGNAIKKFLYGNVTFQDSSGNNIGVNRIIKVTATTVVFQKPLTNSSDVYTVIAYQGCTKRFSSCKNKFNANPYFGGFPYLPRVNNQAASLEGPLPNQDRIVPEIIGAMWTKPTIFYISPSPIVKTENLEHGTANISDNSYFSSSVEALCVKSDFLLGLKVFGKKIRIGETNTRAKTGSNHFPANEGWLETDFIFDGDFPPVRDSQRLYYNIADYEEKSPKKSNQMMIKGPDEYASNIKQDPYDASSELVTYYISSGISSNPEPSHWFRQYMEFYSGTNRLTTPIIDYLEEKRGLETKGMKYPDLSYIVFGPVIKPARDSRWIPERTEMSVVSMNGYLGSHRYEEAETELSKKDRKEFDPDHEALVYHSPTINSSASTKDFSFALRTGGTAFSNYTTLSASISTGDTSVYSPNLVLSGSYYVRSDLNKIVATSGGSFTTELKVGDYILFESTGPHPSPNPITETPRKVTDIVSDTELYYEGTNFSQANNHFGNLWRSPAFFTRPDFNSGDAVKVGNEFYIIDKIESETTFYVEPSIRETVASATVAIADYVGANPANTLYYILNSILDISSGDIDITSFTDARDQLYTEEIGVNVKINTLSTLRSKVNAILDLINGVLYWDSTAGKFKLGLMRDTNYGSQTINSVKKTYSSANSSNFTVETNSYDDIYTHVAIDFSNPFDEAQNNIIFDQCNETTRGILGYTKFKSLSNEFVTNSSLAQFYLNLKFNQYTQIQNKVKLRIPIDDLNLLHQGCLISYSDSAYALNFVKIRVDKISGFNEFASYLNVEGHVEYSVDDYSVFAPDLEPEEATISNIESVEIIPCGIDPFITGTGLRNDDFLERIQGPSYILPTYKAKSLTAGAKIKFLDKDDIELGTSFLNRSALKCHLKSEYSATGFIDKSSTGILLTIPAGTEDLFAVTRTEYDMYAIISRLVQNPASGTIDSIEESDYELISFKKLEITQAATATTDGECRITDICRNLDNQNYFQVDPYDGGSSKYEAGKTDVTGQFTHSQYATIYLFIRGELGLFQLDSISDQSFAPNFKLNVEAQTSTGTITGTSASDSLIYQDPSIRGGSFGGRSSIDNLPYWKLFYPPPPAKLYGYSRRHGSHYYYFVYWTPANNSSGAGWRNPDSTRPVTFASNTTVIEYTTSVDPISSLTTVSVGRSESFDDNFHKEGGITATTEYVKGYFRRQDMPLYYTSAYTELPIYSVEANTHVSVFNTLPTSSGTINDIEMVDVKIDKPIANYGGFWIRLDTMTTGMRFYVSHKREEAKEALSEKRLITIPAPSGSGDATSDLVIA